MLMTEWDASQSVVRIGGSEFFTKDNRYVDGVIQLNWSLKTFRQSPSSKGPESM